jgi:hypothetical protein
LSKHRQNLIYTPSALYGRLIEREFDSDCLEYVLPIHNRNIVEKTVEDYRSELDCFIEEIGLADIGKTFFDSENPLKDLTNVVYENYTGPGLRQLSNDIETDSDIRKMNMVSYFDSRETVIQGVTRHFEPKHLKNPSQIEITSQKEVKLESLLEALKPHDKLMEIAYSEEATSEVKKDIIKVAHTNHPLYVPYILEKHSISQHEFLDKLEDIPGEKQLELEENIVYLSRTEETVSYYEYNKYLTDKVNENQDLSKDTIFRRAHNNLIQLLKRETENYPEGKEEFVYTFFNPESLGDQKVQDFHGENEQLQDEKNEVRREVNSVDNGTLPSLAESRSIDQAIGEVITYAQEKEIPLRIMSPWIDDSSTAFVSDLKKAAENGVEIRIMMRSTTRFGWNRLTASLLEKLGASQQNVEIRTYTRLKENKGPENSREEFKKDQSKGVFGIHGKMVLATDGQEGKGCISSANITENSLYWNAETGILTSSPATLKPAVEFFDLIWDLGETLNPERIKDDDYDFVIPAPYRR